MYRCGACTSFFYKGGRDENVFKVGILIEALFHGHCLVGILAL